MGYSFFRERDVLTEKVQIFDSVSSDWKDNRNKEAGRDTQMGTVCFFSVTNYALNGYLCGD